MRSVFAPLMAIGLSITLSAFAFNTHAAGNADEGKKKFYTCTGCHGIAGYKNAYPNYSVPKVGGQNEAYLIVALNAYKTGERKHPTMRAQAQSLSEQDIADISTFLAAAK